MGAPNGGPPSPLPKAILVASHSFVRDVYAMARRVVMARETVSVGEGTDLRVAHSVTALASAGTRPTGPSCGPSAAAPSEGPSVPSSPAPAAASPAAVGVVLGRAALSPLPRALAAPEVRFAAAVPAVSGGVGAWSGGCVGVGGAAGRGSSTVARRTSSRKRATHWSRDAPPEGKRGKRGGRGRIDHKGVESWESNCATDLQFVHGCGALSCTGTVRWQARGGPRGAQTTRRSTKSPDRC